MKIQTKVNKMKKIYEIRVEVEKYHYLEINPFTKCVDSKLSSILDDDEEIIPSFYRSFRSKKEAIRTFKQLSMSPTADKIRITLSVSDMDKEKILTNFKDLFTILLLDEYSDIKILAKKLRKIK